MSLQDSIRRMNQLLMQELLRRKEQKDRMSYLKTSLEGYNRNAELDAQRSMEYAKESARLARENDIAAAREKASSAPLFMELHNEIAIAENNGDTARAQRLQAMLDKNYDDYGLIFNQLIDQGPESLDIKQTSKILAWCKGETSTMNKFLESADQERNRRLGWRQQATREGELELGRKRLSFEAGETGGIPEKDISARQISLIEDLTKRVNQMAFPQPSTITGYKEKPRIEKKEGDYAIKKLNYYRSKLTTGKALTEEETTDVLNMADIAGIRGAALKEFQATPMGQFMKAPFGAAKVPPKAAPPAAALPQKKLPYTENDVAQLALMIKSLWKKKTGQDISDEEANSRARRKLAEKFGATAR